MLTDREEGANELSMLFIRSERASTVKKVKAALDSNVNKLGDWGKGSIMKKKALVKYYDFDRNIRSKTFMSNALFGLRLDHMRLLSRFTMSIKPPSHSVINTIKHSIRGRGHTSLVVAINLEIWGLNQHNFALSYAAAWV